ncbi:TetR/AcrR family transcriptional regulator [Cohnella faecalis]|uniref:TetR/AcrR family transcriptional regulator n=2 Tax=Cohnella faecalis TaxID=2315694 RepID=A0A398CE11_9BACL|nr:TetR/AcrR family transcriptional regulator [Cohnella faecalis]
MTGEGLKPVQDKKRTILEAAIRCFSRKGFHATSIQEIAREIGMAKGSMYFYFNSKDELYLSVLEYYTDMLFRCMEELPEDRELSSRDKLRVLIERQFRFFREHLHFMRMLFLEPATGLNPQVQNLLMRTRARSAVWTLSHISAIYGNRAARYVTDAATMFEGMTGRYLEKLFFDDAELDEGRVSRFLINRIDHLMKGLLLTGEEPILPAPDMNALREKAGWPLEAEAQQRNGQLEELKRLVSAIPDSVPPAVRTEAASALERLESEWAKLVPDKLLAKGCLRC